MVIRKTTKNTWSGRPHMRHRPSAWSPPLLVIDWLNSTFDQAWAVKQHSFTEVIMVIPVLLLQKCSIRFKRFWGDKLFWNYFCEQAFQHDLWIFDWSTIMHFNDDVELAWKYFHDAFISIILKKNKKKPTPPFCKFWAEGRKKILGFLQSCPVY